MRGETCLVAGHACVGSAPWGEGSVHVKMLYSKFGGNRKEEEKDPTDSKP